jgi:hypothetical protein
VAAAAAPKLRRHLAVPFNVLAPATRALISNERLQWLRGLPRVRRAEGLARRFFAPVLEVVR